jgi:hypothetical protein
MNFWIAKAASIIVALLCCALSVANAQDELDTPYRAYCGRDCSYDVLDAAGGWTDGPNISYHVPGGTCTVTIFWGYRINPCDGRREIQITDVMVSPVLCAPSPTVEQLLREGYREIIRINTMSWPPTSNNECASTWRVVNGSCWTRVYDKTQIQV